MAGPFNEAQQARFDTDLQVVLARYPADQRPAAMLPTLRLVQEILGWIPPEAMVLVADRLGVPPARAEEVATFYVMFHTRPAGQHVIDVCTNVSCCLRGGEKVLAYLEKKLGIRSGQTTSDKRFTLREVECLASCGSAPVMQVDEVFVEELTPSKIDQKLAALE
ncbi:MAG: NADH-quinone oxidoreductase subunit NuoE [Deltaproteobacteria bacterium]|nr:NADH-quinone oxidoreductase subunit NuoE [Deltaproteobacteria bacterium]